jgi:hypothetical protein
MATPNVSYAEYLSNTKQSIETILKTSPSSLVEFQNMYKNYEEKVKELTSVMQENKKIATEHEQNLKKNERIEAQRKDVLGNAQKLLDDYKKKKIAELKDVQDRVKVSSNKMKDSRRVNIDASSKKYEVQEKFDRHIRYLEALIDSKDKEKDLEQALVETAERSIWNQTNDPFLKQLM